MVSGSVVTAQALREVSLPVSLAQKGVNASGQEEGTSSPGNQLRETNPIPISLAS